MAAKPYKWMNAGPTPRGPNPVSVAEAPVGRPPETPEGYPGPPPVGVIPYSTPDANPFFSGTSTVGGPVEGRPGPYYPPAPGKRPRFTRPPVSGGGDGENDLPPRWIGPPIRDGGGKGGGTDLIGPGPTPGKGGGTDLIGPGPTPVDPGGFTGGRGVGLIGPGPTPANERGGTGLIGPGPTPGDSGGPLSEGDPMNPGGGRWSPRRPYDTSDPYTTEQARRRFGRWPGMGDQAAPQPEIVPGSANFNPFTGEWS